MNNTYFLMRHGESLKNKKNITSCWPEKFISPLTKEGEKEVGGSAEKLEKLKISLIFSSDILRARQTAKIVSQRLKIEPEFDKRLRDIYVGSLNGKPLKEMGDFYNQGKKLTPFQHYKKRFKIAPPGGETYIQAEERIKDFFQELEKKYKKKNILIIAHERIFTLLEKNLCNYSMKKFVNILIEGKELRTGEFKKLKV